MIQIARTWRGFAGGIAAGFIGVVIVSSGTASADPLISPTPAPAPVPAQAMAPPVQNLTAVPGGVSTNRFAPAQAPAQAPVQVPAPVASPLVPTIPATGAAPAAVAAMPPTTPAITGTLREYLTAKGVQLEAQRPQGFKALDITMPMPPRWTHVPDPNVPDAFAVFADRVGGTSIYTSNAQLVVYKLVGDFDPAEAITHGYVDSQQRLAWQTTNAALANLGGFPSSVIEGTFRENDMTLNTSRRHVIASVGADRYLLSLSVTTAAAQAIADAPATDTIINGFRVAAPTAATQAPARVAPPSVLPQTPFAPSHSAPLAGPGPQLVPNPTARAAAAGYADAGSSPTDRCDTDPRTLVPKRAIQSVSSYCERMLIAGVLCVCAAVASAMFGIWSLAHQPTADSTQLALRAMAPTQLAAAIMLAAGGAVALAAAPHTALVVVIVCIAGALGTLATGSVQSARFTLRRDTARSEAADCGGACAVCTLSCH